MWQELKRDVHMKYDYKGRLRYFMQCIKRKTEQEGLCVMQV